MAQGMQNRDKRMDELEKQVGQIADFMGQFREQGKLPSSTVVNPRGGVETAKAITLRSGKEVGTEPKPSKSALKEDEKLQIEEKEQAKATARIEFLQAKNEEEEKDVLETFRKVHVNIPLLEAIKQIPKYAKFLKKLCTTRKRIREKEVVHVSENVFALLQRSRAHKIKPRRLNKVDIGSKKRSSIIGHMNYHIHHNNLPNSIQEVENRNKEMPIQTKKTGELEKHIGQIMEFLIPKQEVSEKDIVEALPKVQKDIPILGATKQVLDRVEYFKGLCFPRRMIQEKVVAKECQDFIKEDKFETTKPKEVEFDDIGQVTTIIVNLAKSNIPETFKGVVPTLESKPMPVHFKYHRPFKDQIHAVGPRGA
ncbi:uncharacterized protein [Malus domestica]|uniref:uncharacterized protein n=1 Tax=Malus domestica TaxID=3750 RepID=UPI0039758CC6